MGATAVAVGLRNSTARKVSVSRSDDQLVEEVRAGDPTAFEAIYDRYARGLFAFCLHMLRSREESEDVLQGTFASAYRALRSGDAEISLRPWLYTIARNRCLSQIRSRRTEAAADPGELTHGVLDCLAEEVQRREDLRELLDDIQRLPEEQRAALVLFELGDHSHGEIARVLGVRREKVKALIFQARQGLMRGRQARSSSCAKVRERLANGHATILPRSMTRAHIDRCAGCAAFEHELSSQRSALALVLPATLAVGLKAAVLGPALGGSGAVAVGAGASGTGAAAGAGAAGGATAAGGVVAAGGTGGAGVTAAAGGVAAASTGVTGTAVIAGAPVAAVATGLTVAGAEYVAATGLAGLGATKMAAKLLVVAAAAAGAAGPQQPANYASAPARVTAAAVQSPLAPVVPVRSSAVAALTAPPPHAPAPPSAAPHAPAPAPASASASSSTATASPSAASPPVAGEPSGTTTPSSAEPPSSAASAPQPDAPQPAAPAEATPAPSPPPANDPTDDGGAPPAPDPSAAPAAAPGGDTSSPATPTTVAPAGSAASASGGDPSAAGSATADPTAAPAPDGTS